MADSNELRVVHIVGGQIVTTSVEGAGWVAPQDGSEMLLVDAIAACIPFAPLIPGSAPEATPLQVHAFLIRRGISLESIPALIAAVTAEGEEREEALMRWDKTLSFPKEHPLVAAVAAQLELNLDEVWSSILAIE